jgi:hypothetical protein
MSREQQIEYIRRKCEARGMKRPMRLADMLLAIGGGKRIHPGGSNDMGYFISEDDKLKAQWNLRTDSLEAQSEECITFLYDLLSKA